MYASAKLVSVHEHAASQILSELGPMDLLNVARTNKDLRQFLMSRKSILVWVYARRNAGATKVPDPPEDMSEPAWALLLFGPAVCSVRSQCSFSHHLDLKLMLSHRNAVEGTSTGSTLPFAVACALRVGRESEQNSLLEVRTALIVESIAASSQQSSFGLYVLTWKSPLLTSFLIRKVRYGSSHNIVVNC
jgi:hypothetical protein